MGVMLRGPEDRMPTEEELARIAGLSRAKSTRPSCSSFSSR